MTEVKNEMLCGTIDSTLKNINLVGEMKVSKEGILMSIQSGMVYDVTSTIANKKYIGSFNVSNDAMNPSSDTRSISINISDISRMSDVSAAIVGCLTDIEAKYKPAV